jgi:SLT domain-containing protein
VRVREEGRGSRGFVGGADNTRRCHDMHNAQEARGRQNGQRIKETTLKRVSNFSRKMRSTPSGDPVRLCMSWGDPGEVAE